MTKRRISSLLIALCLCLPAVGCDDRESGVDSGPRDAATRTDSGPMDAGADAGRADSGVDAGPTDAGTDAGMDASPEDASTDAGPSDAGPTDAGPTDAGPPPDAGPFVGGDTCAMAFDVTAGGTFRGSTVGASDTYDDAFPCSYGAGANGAEVVYSVTPSVVTQYRVTATVHPDDIPSRDGGSRPTIQLWTRADCASDACPDGTRSALTFTAPAGITTFLFVEDQQFVATGFPFTLEVTVE